MSASKRLVTARCLGVDQEHEMENTEGCTWASKISCNLSCHMMEWSWTRLDPVTMLAVEHDAV